MKVAEIKTDVRIIKCLHKVWVFPHFKYLQGGDKLTGSVAGYQSRFILQCLFLMWKDLDKMCNGKWKQNGEFENVMENTPSK